MGSLNKILCEVRLAPFDFVFLKGRISTCQPFFLCSYKNVFLLKWLFLVTVRKRDEGTEVWTFKVQRIMVQEGTHNSSGTSTLTCCIMWADVVISFVKFFEYHSCYNLGKSNFTCKSMSPLLCKGNAATCLFPFYNINILNWQLQWLHSILSSASVILHSSRERVPFLCG